MKKTFLLSLLYCSFLHFSSANGVAIVNAANGTYLQLISSSVQVRIQDQIAITTTTQVFKNQLSASQSFKYGFPMPSGGTATALRWQKAGVWHIADFNGAPQDTILPGGGGGGQNVLPALAAYLGAFPLYFSIENPLAADSLITIELTYVELLKYKNGTVSYLYPANYTSIQSGTLVQQHFELAMASGRQIESASMVSHPGAQLSAGAHEVNVLLDIWEQAANKNFQFDYQLSANDLGLFSFSIFLEDTLDCDNYGQGFCAFVVEPNPNPNADIIPKVFTLVVDRSGSMSGNKMVQARDAATFIVNNLNEGDLFNVIDFDNQITSFKPDHVPYTNANRDAALSYISTLYARGSTDISGAFSSAIPQFANDNADTYNIIIFFTDGVPTAGLTGTTEILNHINSLITPLEKEISIFTFGVGTDVNKPLLTQIANSNNGTAQFLDNNELASSISEFYQTVRNPVMLNTAMSFDPNLVYETYPLPLPNLYKGSQMLVVGRYNTPGTVNVHFTGSAFGSPVTYDYPMVLTDKDSVLMRFLPKIWAKQKAEHLLQQYYAATDPGLIETLEAEIEHLSLCYGVITDLTSFVDNSGGQVPVYETPFRAESPNAVQIIAISPNPASEQAEISIEFLEDIFGDVSIELLDPMGRVIQSTLLRAHEAGIYKSTLSIDPGTPRGMYWIRVLSEKGAAMQLLVLR